MRGAWSLTALAVSVAAQELPDWKNENTIDWRTFGQWTPSTTEAPPAAIKTLPPTPLQFTQKAPHGYPSAPPDWRPTQHAVAKQVSQESPAEWGTPEAPSVSIVYEAMTNTIYTTVDVTVTSCPAVETACPAAIAWVKAGSEESSEEPWEETTTEVPFEKPTKPTKTGKPHKPFSAPTAKPWTADCEGRDATLTNADQVGNSTWGTLCQPTFPKWLDHDDGSKYNEAPWGDKTTKNSDATVRDDVPVTGDTRYYDFNITRDQISTDGVLRDVILINGQFPGPLIEANWGDWIEVTVHNNIEHPFEGTAVHWHGLLQRDTQWYDGVPAVGQCPIAPMHSFTYKFQAELFGSSWYHAHYSAQYTGGIVGPIQVYGPTQMEYDIDIGPVMLSDWFHVPYFSIVADAVGTDLSVIPPTSDNILINGRAKHDCSIRTYDDSSQWIASNLESNITWTCVDNAPLSKFRFESGKTHRLRISNIGADGIMKFSIDGHTMTVITIDFVPVVPKEANVVTLGVGQRTDILVTANNHTESAYWMRTSAPGGEACGGSSVSESLAAIYYDDADTTILPTTASAYNETECVNDPLEDTIPEYPITPSANPFISDLELALVMNATGNYEWQINNQTFRANFNEPILFKAAEGNVSYPLQPQWAVHNYDRNNSVVLNVTNKTPFAHPFHLHGHNMYILDEGTGTWDGSIRNAQNPARRDIQTIRAGGFAAMQFEADNPGVWRKFSLNSPTFTCRLTKTNNHDSFPLPRSLALIRRPRHERPLATRRYPADPQRHARDVRRLGLVQLAQRRRPDRRRLVEGEGFIQLQDLSLCHHTTLQPFPCVLAYCVFVVTSPIFLRKLSHLAFFFSITIYRYTRACLKRGGGRGRAAADREGERENEEIRKRRNMRIMINPSLGRRNSGERSEA
jgi:FtsP/CotA-like multicopper oxidase with cupredoxin domain